MNLERTDEQRMLADSARGWLARACPLPVVRALEASERGFDADHWRAVADLGWTGLLIPEEHGGAGRAMVDFAVLCEELGRALFPSPLVPSTTLGALPLLWSGHTRWLPDLADGTTIATLIPEPGALVAFAAHADLALAVHDDELFLTDTFVSERVDSIGGEPLHRVTVDPSSGETIGPAQPVVGRAVDHATVASLAYTVGAAERTLEMTVAYAKDRHQFGRPIGAFQAVAHRCAVMRADLDACRVLAHQAAWALDRGGAADLEVAAAKAYANDAMRRVAMNAHQVHGAIGFSTEHDLQLFTRRLKAFELTYGSTASHRERVARAMGL